MELQPRNLGTVEGVTGALEPTGAARGAFIVAVDVAGMTSRNEIPSLFSQSAIESCSNIAGALAGEALVRRISNGSPGSPEKTYKRTDVLLWSGSDAPKQAIDQRFRSKVREFFKIAMNLATRRIRRLGSLHHPVQTYRPPFQYAQGSVASYNRFSKLD